MCVPCEMYCISDFANQNLWYEKQEQLDSGGGGALSRGASCSLSSYQRL